MTPGANALTVTFGIATVGVTIGFLAGLRRKMDLEQWTVGGRGFVHC
jgi:Na+/proline symporter